MLHTLYVKNYALFDEIEVSFGNGLNIITGETGAGKSILIGACSLLLGEGAKSGMVRKGTEKAIVEGHFFFGKASAVETFLKTEDLLADVDEVIVRREVTKKGRSRAFVNDTPVTLKQLKELGDLFVDLHGQHEHQSLLHTNEYPDVLDGFGNNRNFSSEVKSLYLDYQRATKDLERLREQEREIRERQDYYSFQLKEISEVNPGSVSEDEDLEREINLLENHERVWEITNRSYLALYEAEGSVIDTLQTLVKELQDIENLDPRLEEAKNELQTAADMITETAKSLSSFCDEDAFDLSALDELRNRAAALSRFKRKYLKTLQEILEYRTFLEEELARSETLDESIKSHEKQCENLAASLESACLELSKKREAAAGKMEKQVTKGMKALGMPSAQFQIRLSRDEDPAGIIRDDRKRFRCSSTGIDQIQFFVSTNPGEDLQPLTRVASGGEISRIMLAIKTVLAERHQVPILVFDEIDSGISGRIASIVGKQIRELGLHKQVLAITHLPQIAGCGDFHFSVRKEAAGSRAVTKIARLSHKDRTREIAKLIGGETISSSSLKSAEELLVVHGKNKT